VGGVSERAGAKAGGSDSSAQLTPSRRGGERHPGLLEGGALRGATSEGGSRSVRRVQRASTRGTGAPMTADVRRAPRRGTPSAYATTRMHLSQAREIVACARGRVLRSVLRPVHVDPHYAPQPRGSVVGRLREHHGWASSGNREEPALGLQATDGARLAARHRSRKGEGATRSRRGRRSRPPSLRGSGARVWLPARRNAVAEVGRRRLVPNKLGKRAPKRAVRVE